ncbi:hypothetical protein ABZX77_46705 [Streptomyces sp. NPDC004237]|uniref:hypothetical protein n=1 Tax=Streptomyces sp. NPDC004237 TaxID=3154455 RepID=UPI0033A2EF60
MAAEWIAATSSGLTATIVGSGLVGLVLADVLRPSLSWQMARRARHMQERFPLVRDPEGFARLQTLAGPGRWASLTGRRAVNDLTKIMVAKGGTLADITVGDALEYRAAWRSITPSRQDTPSSTPGCAASAVFQMMLRPRSGT